MRRRLLFIAPAALAGMLLLMALGGQVVKLLWNWLLPPLFGWPLLTFWQALGLLALCRILFGGLGGRGGGYRGVRRRVADRVAERRDAMTPDERDRFRQAMRDRCGFERPIADRAPRASE